MTKDNLLIQPLETLAGSKAYLYGVGRDGVILDGGLGCEKLLDVAETHGITVHALLLTHSHYDHICGLPLFRERMPETPIYLHHSGIFSAKHPVLNLSTFLGQNEGIPGPYIPYTHGEILRFCSVQLEVIHTPGHSLCSSCFYDGVHLFSGDTVFVGAVGRTDMFFGDFYQMMRSIKNRLLPLPDDSIIHPGHEDRGVWGKEKRWNPFFGRYVT